MITTALICPAFVADTLRHSVIECTYKAYVPHRACRLVSADPRHLLADELQPLRPFKTPCDYSLYKIQILI
jgi:hypothetical protein|nr:MAG TPA: hypothetical protein [Caudoviricetes sp.]